MGAVIFEEGGGSGPPGICVNLFLVVKSLKLL